MPHDYNVPPARWSPQRLARYAQRYADADKRGELLSCARGHHNCSIVAEGPCLEDVEAARGRYRGEKSL
jgi:hypothetical protein